MHVPDGFFNAATSLAAGAASAGTLAIGLKKAALELTERLAPMAGLVAAFVFALQMLNFPVAAGTSGHLLGGALAAILVGPWVGMICIAIVLLVQGLLFADGGLTAYGVNVLLLAVAPTLLGFSIYRLVTSVLPKSKGSVVAGSATAAFLSVPVAAAIFALLFAFGGSVQLPFGRVLAAMVGTHLLIGVGEALITATVVSAVVNVRPDLVYGATHLNAGALLSAPDPKATA
ncbi:MAG: energy-coupling factor ABC transporter permease [Actinomycetota bacterium]